MIREIAEKLFVSENTVKTHTGRLFDKLSASRRTQAVQKAKEAGLIGDDHIVAEIGEVLLGRVEARPAPETITFYKSLGHIVQDLSATRYLHARAQGEG